MTTPQNIIERNILIEMYQFVLEQSETEIPNMHRVSTVIKEFASQAHFMVISHREENMVNADRIYGVSMQQSGITDIFSVDLEQEAK